MSHVERTAKELLLLAPAGHPRVEFHGRTMEPLLRDGDLLTRLNGDSIVLSADNWPDFHATARTQDVIGKVVRRTRAGGDLSCEDWSWWAHTALALMREALRSITPLVRRKRTRFALSAPP